MPETLDLFGEGPTPTDAAYRHIIESPRPEPREARDLINALWQKAAPYLEPGFPNRLRFEFHACFWEMYLTAVLLEHKLPVIATCHRRHRAGKGPDIQVGSVEAWFEAIAVTAGAGPDAVPGYSFNEVAPVPNERFMLRLTAAIQEKLRKYQKYLREELLNQSEPFVIAVNAGGVPFLYQEAYLPRIISVLFPFGDPAVRFDRKTNTFGELYFTYRAELKKKSGATIPTTIFEREESRGISAVVYSTAEAFNCRGVLGCDLILIHNPIATAPLRRVYLPIGRECWCDGNEHNICETGTRLVCAVQRCWSSVGAIPTWQVGRSSQ